MTTRSRRRAPPGGGSNGHEPNWAQMIAEAELRFERQIATLKEEKSSGIMTAI